MSGRALEFEAALIVFTNLHNCGAPMSCTSSKVSP